MIYLYYLKSKISGQRYGKMKMAITKEQNGLKNRKKNRKISNAKEIRDITISHVRTAISNTNNWTSPGFDKIPNFWLKNLEELHMDMAREYTILLKEPNKCPEWLTQGLTFLIQ